VFSYLDKEVNHAGRGRSKVADAHAALYNDGKLEYALRCHRKADNASACVDGQVQRVSKACSTIAFVRAAQCVRRECAQWIGQWTVLQAPVVTHFLNSCEPIPQLGLEALILMERLHLKAQGAA
jgi:hypothetical protein